MFFSKPKPASIPSASEALPGRTAPLAVDPTHALNGNAIAPPFPGHLRRAVFALGCFWGAERVFWRLEGVWSTAVGYAGGHTPNPTYQEVCSGMTGHTEVVLVVYDPGAITYEALLRTFWESHDPTQGMRQGNDVGTQYRSAIYTATDEDLATARASLKAYEAALGAAGMRPITTEVRPEPPFYYAETYHQQYMHKNPGGYCGIRGTGVSCPIDPREG